MNPVGAIEIDSQIDRFSGYIWCYLLSVGKVEHMTVADAVKRGIL